MNNRFEQNLIYFGAKKRIALFREIRRGLEKESLRVDSSGMLAQTPHPKALGASLTHPFITTDHSEALLEFVTSPTSSVQDLFQQLTELHAFTYSILQDEVLFAASMPGHLPPEQQIPIAEFGRSNVGRLKYIYRKGLKNRYGSVMQTIAGIHYNFSLSQSFFEEYYQKFYPSPSPMEAPLLKDFISEQYLAMIRNGLRWGWLFALLFGATPAIDQRFFNPKTKIAKFLKPLNDDTFYGPDATSLRLSEIGYHNKDEQSRLISYHSFPDFLQSVHYAVHTPDLNFSKIGIKIGDEYQQLSDSFLQTEDEHYAMIRPKRVSVAGERTVSAMMRDGIEYLEVRALDINPFLPLGIEPTTVYFLDVFLITCLFLESPPLDKQERQNIQENISRIVIEGRNPNLQIINNTGKEQNALLTAHHFLNLMLKTAELLDKAYGGENFGSACRETQDKLYHLDNLPSAKVVQALKEKTWSYVDFALYWSLQHKDYFRHLHLPQKLVIYYQNLAKASFEKQAEIERTDLTPFPEFLAKFLSP